MGGKKAIFSNLHTWHLFYEGQCKEKIKERITIHTNTQTCEIAASRHTSFKEVFLFTVLQCVNAWFMRHTVCLPLASISNETKLFSSRRLGFPTAAWKHSLFAASVRILTGSAVAVGCSIVFRLVIWALIELCLNFLSTYAERQKSWYHSGGKKDENRRGGQRERWCFHMPDLVSDRNIYFQI